MTTTDALGKANNVLMSSGMSPERAELPMIGASVSGQIIGARDYQIREYSPAGQGPLRYYPSGDPMMGLIIDLRTQQRTSADDDGTRRLYAEKRRMRDAIRDAILATGQTGLQVGAHLEVTWTGTEPTEGGMPANTYSARYSLPSHPVPGTSQPRTQQPPAQPSVAPQQNRAAQALAQQQATTQAPPRPTLKASMAAAMANAGVDITQFDIVPD